MMLDFKQTQRPWIAQLITQDTLFNQVTMFAGKLQQQNQRIVALKTMYNNYTQIICVCIYSINMYYHLICWVI